VSHPRRRPWHPLVPLTKHRSEPAVPIAGKYRLIDIPSANCLNSKAQSHLRADPISQRQLAPPTFRTPTSSIRFSRGFVEVLAAQQTNEAAEWYQGTADAVRQNIRYVH